MNIPESLRYILWRYSQDHSGEDHQHRHADATAFLNQPPPISLSQLQSTFTEAIKITGKERAMRSYVFKNKPDLLAPKLAEIDRLESILISFKDALKHYLIPPDQPEQQTLLDVPKKQDYP